MDDVSPALKRMKATYYELIQEECYQDRHISDDFTNLEQINLCKSEQKDKIFGKFEKMLNETRLSDNLKFNHCVLDAGNDFNQRFNCQQYFLGLMRSSNEKMKARFNAEHRNYL